MAVVACEEPAFCSACTSFCDKSSLPGYWRLLKSVCGVGCCSTLQEALLNDLLCVCYRKCIAG